MIRYPRKICNDMHPLSQCPKIEDFRRLASGQTTSQQPAVLTNPFPNQQMVIGTHPPPEPLQGGNQGAPPQGGNGSDANIYMCDQDVQVTTQTQSYDVPSSGTHDKEASTLNTEPLHIEKPHVDMMPCVPRGVLKKSAHNPNARAA